MPYFFGQSEINKDDDKTHGQGAHGERPRFANLRDIADIVREAGTDQDGEDSGIEGKEKTGDGGFEEHDDPTEREKEQSEVDDEIGEERHNVVIDRDQKGEWENET